jgi:hypothetical protein
MKEENLNLKKLMKEIPLETRIKVTTEIELINFLIDLGLKDEGYWTPKDDELFKKLIKFRNKLTNYIMEDIEEFKKDQEND